jgi:hypothetical protein
MLCNSWRSGFHTDHCRAALTARVCLLAQDKLFRGTRMSIYNQSFYMTMVSAVLSFSGAPLQSPSGTKSAHTQLPRAMMIYTAPDKTWICCRAADQRPAGAGGALRVAAPQGAGLNLCAVHGGHDRSGAGACCLTSCWVGALSRVHPCACNAEVDIAAPCCRPAVHHAHHPQLRRAAVCDGHDDAAVPVGAAVVPAVPPPPGPRPMVSHLGAQTGSLILGAVASRWQAVALWCVLHIGAVLLR